LRRTESRQNDDDKNEAYKIIRRSSRCKVREEVGKFCEGLRKSRRGISFPNHLNSACASMDVLVNKPGQKGLQSANQRDPENRFP